MCPKRSTKIWYGIHAKSAERRKYEVGSFFGCGSGRNYPYWDFRGNDSLVELGFASCFGCVKADAMNALDNILHKCYH